MDVSRFAGRDGAQLAYRETGSGRPLILLSGFLGTGSYWLDRGPADTLAEQGFCLVLPDFRGHGESTRSHDPLAFRPTCSPTTGSPSSSTSGSAPTSTTARRPDRSLGRSARRRSPGIAVRAGLARPTPEDGLRRITIPPLVVIGDRDERSDADELAALLPAGRYVRVPGGHGGAFEAPEFAAAITASLTAYDRET